MKNQLELRRAIALLMDAVIIVMIFWATKLTLEDMNITYAGIVAYANCYLMTILFPVAIWEGQSIGKKIMKLRVVSKVSSQHNKSAIFARELSKSILFTGIDYSILAIMFAFPIISKEHQGLHDYICKTKVIDINDDIV